MERPGPSLRRGRISDLLLWWLVLTHPIDFRSNGKRRGGHRVERGNKLEWFAISVQATSVVPPFSGSEMFPQKKQREREREWISVNRLFIRTSGTTRDSIFLEEIQPSKEEFEEFQPAVCRFNRGGCRFNETIESRFRLKNGPLEMKSSLE